MPFNQNKKGMDMKKELVLLGSMIAMSGALSSCCCKRSAEYAYAQKRQNAYETAQRVVNYKDGGTVHGTPGYVQPTSAEGTTLTAPAQQNGCHSQGQSNIRYVPVHQTVVVDPMTTAIGVDAAVKLHAHTQNLEVRADGSNAQGVFSVGTGQEANISTWNNWCVPCPVQRCYW